jgi:hypothetical protein
MIESLVNKVFFLIFFMAIFNIVRHIWEIIRRLRAEDGWKKKYEISTVDLVLLITSISYLLSTIFVGIKI